MPRSIGRLDPAKDNAHLLGVVASNSARTPAEPLDWPFLRRIEERFGSSFYLLDLDRFSLRYRQFTSAFRSVYTPTHIAYSYKTNYTPALCARINVLGGLAEVVSELEYEIAIRAGVAPGKIIVNGPYKPQAFMERVLVAGATVHLDGPSELDAVRATARLHPERRLHVGIRCNLNIGHASRFGFDDRQIGAAMAQLKQIDNVAVKGLHFHVCTPERRPEMYAEAARRLIALAAEHASSIPLSYIDMGGGFFSPMAPQLREQFPFPVFGFEDYAAAIGEEFRSAFPDGEMKLILEPGLAIVADAMQFVARAIAEKDLHGRRYLLVAASVDNIKPTRSPIRLPLTVVGRAAQETVEPFDIVGYTCMEHDVLHSGCRQRVRAGDFVVFDNVGAYSIVLKPPFIHPSPPIVLRDDGGLARRRETIDDLLSAYRF